MTKEIKDEKQRCNWATKTLLEQEYHDNEWGEITHDDKKIFELLILENMQAGLSWKTILQKRASFSKAFDNFDYHKIINYDQNKLDELINNKNIIRNRLKIKSLVSNAESFLNIQKEFGSFDKYIWSFVDNKQIINSWEKMSDIPAKTELSELISKDLKKRNFNFVGPTIVYSFLQAIGIVDDHLQDCFKNKSNN